MLFVLKCKVTYLPISIQRDSLRTRFFAKQQGCSLSKVVLFCIIFSRKTRLLAQYYNRNSTNIFENVPRVDADLFLDG